MGQALLLTDKEELSGAAVSEKVYAESLLRNEKNYNY